MERTQNIEQEIENIKKLRKYYESFVSERNRQDAIDAYHKWHEASCILFSRYFDASCKEYANFAYIDYILMHILATCLLQSLKDKIFLILLKT